MKMVKLVEFLELQNQDVLNQIQVIKEHDLPLKETYFQQGRADMISRLIKFINTEIEANEKQKVF